MSSELGAVAAREVRQGPGEAQHAVVATGRQGAAFQRVVEDPGCRPGQAQQATEAPVPGPASWFPQPERDAAAPAGAPGGPHPGGDGSRSLLGTGRGRSPPALRVRTSSWMSTRSSSGPDIRASSGGASSACRCSPPPCRRLCRRGTGWQRGPAGSGQVGGRAGGAVDDQFTAFQRLPERVEDPSLVLGGFVEEEYATVRPGSRARPGQSRAAADDGGCGSGCGAGFRRAAGAAA